MGFSVTRQSILIATQVNTYLYVDCTTASSQDRAIERSRASERAGRSLEQN